MDTRKRLTELVNERKDNKAYDTELWSLIDAQTQKLQNVGAGLLVKRYRDIASSIVWLVDASRDAETAKAGHNCSWWWFRMLFQLEQELKRRDMEDVELFEVPDPIPLIPELVNASATRSNHWARVGERGRLMKTLSDGEIWFSTAQGFDDASLNEARKDDELRRHKSSPGQTVRILGPKGEAIKPQGDVRYTRTSLPYWLSSWSTELDLRLIGEFAKGGTGVDSCIVVWKPTEFDARVAAAVERSHPTWQYAALPIQYIDEYEMLSSEKKPVSATKDFSFARQRELRLALRARSPQSIGGFRVDIGSIGDIAGVYDEAGVKLDGIGPASICS